MAEWYSIVWAYHFWFTHPFINRHRGWLYLLAIVNSVSIATCAWIFSWVLFKNSLRYMPISEILWSTFNFLRNCKTVFYFNWIILSPWQQCIGIYTSLHFYHCLLLSHSSVMSIQVSVGCYFTFYLHFFSCWHEAHFHLLSGRLGIFFGEISIQILCPMFNQIVTLLLVFKISLHVLILYEG